MAASVADRTVAAMTALRCTAKLLKAMKGTPEPAPRPSINRLGEWTANLVRVSRVQLVIVVSEPTRLGFVIEAAPYAGLRERFLQGLYSALRGIGVPEELAVSEVEATMPLEIASTNSRSVLGTLNQYAMEVDHVLRNGLARSTLELSQRLAETIVSHPAHIGFPADRAREAFGLPPLDHRWVRVEGEPPDTLH